MFALFSDVVEQAWANLAALLQVGLRNLAVELDSMLVRVNQTIGPLG